MGIEPTTRSLGNFGRLGPITPLLGSKFLPARGGGRCSAAYWFSRKYEPNLALR